MYPESDSTPVLRQPRPEDWGRVVAVRGSVVDVAFAEHDLPDIHEAVEIRWDRPGRLVAEVQQHLDPATVRTVALGGTAGLRRGTEYTGPARRYPCRSARRCSAGWSMFWVSRATMARLSMRRCRAGRSIGRHHGLPIRAPSANCSRPASR